MIINVPALEPVKLLAPFFPDTKPPEIWIQVNRESDVILMVDGNHILINVTVKK